MAFRQPAVFSSFWERDKLIPAGLVLAALPISIGHEEIIAAFAEQGSAVKTGREPHER